VKENTTYQHIPPHTPLETITLGSIAFSQHPISTAIIVINKLPRRHMFHFMAGFQLHCKMQLGSILIARVIFDCHQKFSNLPAPATLWLIGSC
jgi:hypothetical protein